MKKYLVGGAVRDKLLQLPVTERDWVVVGTTPQEMLAQGYQQVGKNFPVFLHPENREEYALARAERKYGQGYTGFVCYTSPSVTLEEDLLRRDLTINAIACDEQGNIIDPYHGQKDICQRWLRHVSEAFSDDSLRVLRVARFAARFAHLNFRIAPSTLYLMQNMNTELSLISPERVWKETERALATKNPQVYFKVLNDCGALKVLFPELEALFHVPAPVKLHQKINIGRNTLMKLAIVASLSEDLAVRFAIICHDLGKNITPRELWSNNKIHNTTSIKLLDNLCQRLKVPNYLHNFATIIIKYHNLLHGAEYLTPKKLIKLFNAIDVWRRPNRLEQIIIISEADARRRICFKKNSLGNFLRKAYSITTDISVDKVIAEGFIGNKISKELCLRRQQALALWKCQQ